MDTLFSIVIYILFGFFGFLLLLFVMVIYLDIAKALPST